MPPYLGKILENWVGSCPFRAVVSVGEVVVSVGEVGAFAPTVF